MPIKPDHVDESRHGDETEGKRPPIVPIFIIGFLAMVILRSTLPLAEAVLTTGNFLQTALRKAADSAAALDTELLIVACWKAPDFYNGIVHSDAAVFEDKSKELQADAIMKAFDNGCPVPARLRLTHGSPGTELSTASENAQLLVLGTRGHGEFASPILGSVSLECIAHAHTPVVIVRSQ